MLESKDHPLFSDFNEPLPMPLGINGMGRIGKLLVWHHAARGTFREIVVHIGREAGRGMQDIADYLARDSTYGPLERYIRGFRGGSVLEDVNEASGTLRINGTPVRVLRTERNPKNIPWKGHETALVVECTGAFRDPTVPVDAAKGSLRGHLEAGAEKVILSAPFKIKDESQGMPEDAVTTIEGINEGAYDPARHTLLSAASCTTTCLALMMKVLLDRFGPDPVLGASMVTVHATTSTQSVLDSLPKAGTDDLRKGRAALNNIILTSTGAAKAAALVLPEMNKFGFTAESVRIPSTTGSIVILMVNLQEDPREPIERETINGLYREAANGSLSPYISYSEAQNVSSDIIGTASGAVIEARETRVQKGSVSVAVDPSCTITPQEALRTDRAATLEVPVNQIIVYGWYDNELGSFTHLLGERCVSVAKGLLGKE